MCTLKNKFNKKQFTGYKVAFQKKSKFLFSSYQYKKGMVSSILHKCWNFPNSTSKIKISNSKGVNLDCSSPI